MALGLKPIEIVEKGEHPLLCISPSWVRIPLSSVATVQNGFAFKSEFFNHKEGTPLIRIRDISKVETQNLYSGVYDDEFIVNNGDILIGMDGDFNTSRWSGGKALLNQRVCRLKVGTDLYSEKFLFLCLQPYLNAINAETSSVTVKHLSSRTIQEIPLPLPPLAEQDRIVEKIEELFSELDKGIESLKTAKAQIAVYRQALLKHAFEGKLTEKWRKDNADKLESSEQLLARIQQEREKHYEQQLEEWQGDIAVWEIEGKEGKKPQKPKLRKNTLVTTLSGSYFAWTELGGIALELVLGKMLDKKKNKGIERPYLGNINVRWGKFNLDDLKTMRIEDDERKRYSLEIGDLVICEGGEPGRCAIWEDEEDVYIQKALHRARFTESYNSKFAYYHMLLANANGSLAAEFTGTTIKHLTGKGLEKVKFPLVPYSEQVEIVKRLESQFSEIDKVEEEITCNLLKSEILRQSVLKNAFSGLLVSQDTTDEPASELLKNIAIEKAELAEKDKADKAAAKKAKAEAKKTKA